MKKGFLLQGNGSLASGLNRRQRRSAEQSRQEPEIPGLVTEEDMFLLVLCVNCNLHTSGLLKYDA